MDPYIDPGSLDPKHKLTPLKLANLAQADADHRGTAIRTPGLPSKLVLQTTDVCNLDCPMCQLPAADKRKHMSQELFHRVVDELFATLIELHPTNLGEPLASPWLADLCAAMQQYGVVLDLTTNGTLLDQRRIDLILPIARDIKVSFDGATPATFERLRRNARFDQVCAHVRALAEGLRTVTIRRPMLALQMTLMRSNYLELPDLIRLAHRLGAQRVKAYHLFSFRPEMDAESLLLQPGLWEPVLADALRLGADLGIDLQLAEPMAQSPAEVQHGAICHLPWHETWVDLDGSVLPCHSHAGQRAGDLMQTPFRDIWNGELYQHIRRGFAQRQPTWNCDGCGMTCRKPSEHAAVPYDPASFLSPQWQKANPRPKAEVRWSGRMKQFELSHRRQG
jgi:MoaA/NifB/PqqE/SkfB family radical SAM enzyme